MSSTPSNKMASPLSKSITEDEAAKMLKRRSSSTTQLLENEVLKFESGIHLQITIWLKRNKEKFQQFSTLLFGASGSTTVIRDLNHDGGRWAIPSTVLEHECIALCVALTPLLAHFDEKIRDAVAYSFVDLSYRN